MKNDVQDAVSRPEEKFVGYKERFVAQELSQKEGINYEETFVATRSLTRRVMCAKEGLVQAQETPMG